jgi:putative ABC transport system permease protein
MQKLLKDFRLAARSLLKSRGLTAVLVLALMLGIGANTAIFSVVNTILLRPLEFKDPERLLLIRDNFVKQGLENVWMSPAEYLDIKQQNHSFEDVAAFSTVNYNLTESGDPERIEGLRVTASLVPLLGIGPLQGRVFSADEDKPGSDNVVVISHGLWQRRYGSDPKVIGQTLLLSGRRFTIIGVMPAEFKFPLTNVALGQPAFRASVFTPLAFDAEALAERSSRNLNMIARLKPGVSNAQAQSELTTIAARLEQQHPESYLQNMGFALSSVSLQQEVTGKIRFPLLVLLGAATFVLLIASANVAALLVARAIKRSKEVALRVALGARRWDLGRQMLAETVLIALVGGTIGLFLSVWGVRLLLLFGPQNIPRVDEIGVDSRMLIFTLLVSFATAVPLALIPAFQVSKPNLNEVLNEESGKTSGGLRSVRVFNLLVIGEVALAFVLLIGAGLLIKSFRQLSQIDPGFNRQDLLTMQLTLPSLSYPEESKVSAFYKQLLDQLKAAPGVQSIGAIDALPLSGRKTDTQFVIEGRMPGPGDHLPDEEVRSISPDYFKAMQIPILKGRSLSDSDRAGVQMVVVINQALAHKYFANEDPLGKRLAFDGSSPDKPNWREIVGVAGSVKNFGLDLEPKPEFYLPLAQYPSNTVTLVVRTQSNPTDITGTVRSIVKTQDSNLPVYNIKTMEEVIAASVSQQMLTVRLFGLFSVLALLLASIGVYGVMAYSVTQRTREIGIRMALGAPPRNILKLVMKRGIFLTIAGVIIGLIGAFVLTRVVAKLLFGISATDVTTFLEITLLLVIISLIATLIPAWRATKVNPVNAIRFQ